MLPLPTPESWLLDFINLVASRLSMLGFERDELLLVHSSIVAAHVTGFEHFYDYVVESYYELAEGDDSLLAQPRWKKLFWVVEEEVAALVEFEERLADEDTM
ncbi:MAG: hypothetical protein DSY37_03855, partial [Hyperthermus sp.]